MILLGGISNRPVQETSKMKAGWATMITRAKNNFWTVASHVDWPNQC